MKMVPKCSVHCIFLQVRAFIGHTALVRSTCATYFSEQTKKQSHPQPCDPSSRGSQHVSHSLIYPDQSNIRKPPLVDPGDVGTHSTVQTDPGAEGPSYTPLFLPALGSWRHMAHSHIYYKSTSLPFTVIYSHAVILIL